MALATWHQHFVGAVRLRGALSAPPTQARSYTLQPRDLLMNK